jgi:bacteriocin-like protein
MKKMSTTQMEQISGGQSLGSGIGCLKDILAGSTMAGALGVATALAVCVILY